MQTETFHDKPAPTGNADAQRRDENAQRAAQGQPQVGGAAGRQQVASKDPKGE